MSSGPPAKTADRPLPVFLAAAWRWLVMLNYDVDPALLRPLVPRGTELDLWQDRHVCSLVGFRFEETLVRGWSIPWHRHFDEINLRFYVRRRGPEGWRRAVVFVKEIVPLPAISLVANAVYNERYVTRRMRREIALPTPTTGTGHVTYGWKRHGQWIDLRANIAGDPVPLTLGSEAEFITEHYWGYVTQRDGSTMEYAVEHPAWRVWTATSAAVTGPVEREYGAAFAAVLAQPPRSAFVAEGSAICVRQGCRLHS